MRLVTRFRKRAAAVGSFALLTLVVALVPATSAAAADYVPITGAGSSWSSNAVEQWRRNVEQYGMRVNFASTGSVDGRNQFKAGTVDYAVSETPYGLKDNGVVDTLPSRGFAYMPLVAGGTAFMYNLKAGGKSITNLRLSGEVVTKIFTGDITRWDDKQIKADNPGLSLPKRQIVPVVRSDGSGSTAQFTLWMSKQHPALWNSFCAANGRPSPCGLTSQYPAPKFVKAQSGSLGVAGYVSQNYAEGAITYVEYSYALKSGFPVAKVLNAAGQYVAPTGAAVAVALQKAVINTTASSPDYLTQNLEGVYNSADPVAYPLSSYSYMIVPTATSANFTKEKGSTLSTFANYMLCEGQKQAEVLGYSPLPENLVRAGLEQVARIPGTVAAASECKGPITPPPTAASGSAGAGAAAGATDVAASADGALYDANGALISGGASGGAVSSPFTLADSVFGPQQFVMLFAGILVVAVIALPPVLSRRLKRPGTKIPGQ